MSPLRDGTLLVAGYSGQGTKLDLTNGAVVGTIPVPDVRNAIWVPPADTRDLIVGGYFGRQGDWSDGTPAWDYVPIGCCNIPRIPFALDPVQGTGYFAANDVLYSFDLASGSLFGFSGSGLGFGWASLVDAMTLYTAGTTGSVTRMTGNTPASWTIEWSAIIDAGKLLGPPAVAADGRVVASTGDHLEEANSWVMTPGQLAYVASSGTVAWNIMANATTPPVIGAGGLVYVGTQVPNLDPGGPGGLSATGPGTVTAYALDGGSLIWSTPIAGLPIDLLVGDDGRVYALTAAGVLEALDEVTGMPGIMVTDLPGAGDLHAEAILQDGRIYASGGGVVTAIVVPAQHYDPRSPWPVRFHDNRHTADFSAQP